MAKDNKNFFIFVILFIIGFGLFYFYDGIFSGSILNELLFFDSYLTEDDFSNEGYTVNNWDIKTRYSTYVPLPVENYFHLNSGLSASVNYQSTYTNYIFTYKVNLKNKDIKFKYTVSAGKSPSESIGSTSGAVTFGGQNIASISASTTSIDGLVELIKDVTDKNKFIVIVNGEVTKEIIITSEEAYLEFTMSASQNGRTGHSMKIEYIKSKTYFSCETDNNEVWITDEFDEGSVFNIYDLSYEPTKFCPLDYPAVVRDYRERGTKADYRGTITESLTKGESFTVPLFQSYEIRYATTYKPGITERCNLTSVYSTKLNKCINKVYSQDYLIKDCHSEGCETYNGNVGICMDSGVCAYFENIYIENKCQELGCPEGYDCLPEGLCVKTISTIKDCKTEPCPDGYTCLDSGLCSKSIEIKPTCDDITCDLSLKEYCEMRDGFPVCIRPYKIVEVVREHIFIPVSSNKITFTEDLIIGDKIIDITKLNVNPNCIAESTTTNPECYSTDLSFNGKEYTLKYKESVIIDPYLTVTAYSSGRYKTDTYSIDLHSYNLVLTFNYEFLRIEPIKKEVLDYYVIKDSNREMCFNIYNNLPVTFNSIQSGYSILETTDLITTQQREEINQGFNIGKEEYCIKIDSSRYGGVAYKLTPYFKINDETFYDDEQIIYNYKIVDTIPTNVTTIYKTIIQTINNTETVVIESPSETNWLLIGSIALAFIVLMLLLSKKK